MLLAIYREGGGYDGFRSWVGVQPYADAGFEPHAIVRKIGYAADFGDNEFVPLNATDACAVANFVARGDMVGAGVRPISPEAAASIDQAVAALGPDARFFSNALWHQAWLAMKPAQDGWSATTFGWRPLSKATFDGGLIGFNNICGFVFWVEQED